MAYMEMLFVCQKDQMEQEEGVMQSDHHKEGLLYIHISY